MQHVTEAVSKLDGNKPVVLGSNEGADIVVKGAGVDGRHAQLSRRGAVLVVRDLDSQAGTFVNDQEVRGAVVVRPGDRLRLGHVEIVLPEVSLGSGGTPVGTPASDMSLRPLGLSVVRATKRIYGKARGGNPNRAILDSVSFNLSAGEFLGILGASGSGKSTLIKSIAGLVELSDGAVLLDGRRARAEDLRSDRRIAYLPQDVVIHEALTPLVALDYIGRLKHLAEERADRQQLVRRALDRVGLWAHRETPIQYLSGGQRKRAALAAELLGDPRLILLDEATSGLDPATEDEMMRLFRSLTEEGRTVVCIYPPPGAPALVRSAAIPRPRQARVLRQPR
jgi:ABC-type Mn2+/Zn2+ transport system ATPase subunit